MYFENMSWSDVSKLFRERDTSFKQESQCNVAPIFCIREVRGCYIDPELGFFK